MLINFIKVSIFLYFFLTIFSKSLELEKIISKKFLDLIFENKLLEIDVLYFLTLA